MEKTLNEVTLPLGGLYVLSGPPASGKSTMLKHIDPSMIVSSDEIRVRLLGEQTKVVDNAIAYSTSERANPHVFEIVRAIVEARTSEGLTTFVDAMNLSESDRLHYKDIAEKKGIPFKVLMTPSLSKDEAIARNQGRRYPVPRNVLLNAMDSFVSETSCPFIQLDYDSVIALEPYSFTGTKWDIVGDCHGLFDATMDLLSKAGWTALDDMSISHSDSERKLLFLGDLVDRGPDSIKLLYLVRKAVNEGKAICIKGNHEAKLCSFISMYQSQGIEDWSSYANSDTAMSLLKLPSESRQALFEFMLNLPNYVVHPESATAFVHADIERFDPATSLSSSIVRGDSGWSGKDCDSAYQFLFDAGINKYSLIRGHIPAKSIQANVHSLDNHCYELDGSIKLLKFDQFLSSGDFNASTLEVFPRFDFGEASLKFSLIKAFNHLIENKLVHVKKSQNGILGIYKYSKKVFFDNLWGEHPALLKARGIVLDIAGNIVSHPFDKVFNYGENRAGQSLPNDTIVVATEKLNGFLGVISWNPFTSTLLISTSGSFESPFVTMIKDFVTGELKGRLNKFLFENSSITLLFEVIHAGDPHIISYSSDMFGLHLIGARSNLLNSLEFTEEALDEIASIIGVPRPKHFKATLGQVKLLNKSCTIEGYMLREDSSEQKFIAKLKSPYYLTTKFLGRMNEGNIRFMFANPAEFKKKVDEEFYPLIDLITTKETLDNFLEMNKLDRVSFVRTLTNELVS